ncbi:MAG: DUF4493 domain-containing protein [Candidatus Cryptobacteroides sp.]
MKHNISYLMVALPLLALASCNRELIEPESYGYLCLNMDSDLSADVIVKSSEEQDIPFSVDVVNVVGQTVAHVDDHRTVTAENPLMIHSGSYEVLAYNGENLNASFGNPYYEGRCKIRIIPDQTVTADITCTLANTVFSASFSDDFQDFFEIYQVSVTNGVGEALVLSNSPLEGNPNEAGFDAEAYFAVTGTLSWELYLRNKDGGEYTQLKKTYTDVAAKEHYHLTFNLGPQDSEDGAFTIKVSLDSSMDESSHDIILDYDTSNLPSITTDEESGIVSGETAPIPFGNTEPIGFTMSAPEGIVSFRISHESQELSDLGLPEVVELVGADAQTESLLDALGIDASDVLTRSITEGATAISLDITDFIAQVPVGDYKMDFTIIDTKKHFSTFNLVFEIISDIEADAVGASAGWASFARLEGRFFVLPAPEGLTFQYKEASASSWNEVPISEVSVNSSTKRFTTILKSLKPSTEYVFRAVSAQDKETKEMSFTTSSAETLHNLSFDNWSSNDKMPDAEGYAIWDSANSAGAATTTSPTDDAVSGKAARLESVTAFGLMAAGNIFTGQFVGLAGLGAELDWGVPFTSRPIALRGYYKYAPKTIDKTRDPYTDKAGQTDESQILIFLTDWSTAFRVNTSKKTFVDLDNDAGIIALGQLNSSDTDSGYVKFTLPLVYRDRSRIPTYIVIAAASSRYGDYFTGGVGSVLQIDEFELVYDPAELTQSEFDTVFSKVEPF